MLYSVSTIGIANLNMDIISTIAESVIKRMWEKYSISTDITPYIKLNRTIVLDHLAIIDLGFGSSNRIELSKLFQELGFEINGHGYLPEKMNDFLWMSKKGSTELPANIGIPQIVLGDFRIEKLSSDVRNIVEKCGGYQVRFDFERLRALIHHNSVNEAIEYIISYLDSRPWPILTKEEYQLVEKENQLLGWALMFGRTVNHFALDVQFSTSYDSLPKFNQDIYNLLNQDCGAIQGSKNIGIEQSSTLGNITSIDGSEIMIRGPFLEFVWRYPVKENPRFWGDYYRGFIATNANKIIESVYL